MVDELREYESVNEIVKALDDKINLTKNLLGQYLRRLDEIRSLAERSKKVRDLVTKLAGKKALSARWLERNPRKGSSGIFRQGLQVFKGGTPVGPFDSCL
jgi:hypothetical protein